MAKVISVDDVEPGMILEEDVVNAQGLVLLKSGISIEEKHTKILKRWGVQKIEVAEEAGKKDDRDPEVVLKESKDTLNAEISTRFSKVDTDPLMSELKKVVLAYRTQLIESKYGKK